ncbi:hypothetical protein GFH48_28065 [Streptomyces fagopyri]|uniref:Uncharacterized protein n=1 Tax=Streptomyces fagopyri TaxID=2662397 RepID=A0A5Q0LHU7_9ACTN|nr:hypothetical protein [Streptomyces fagopyri]QFZ76608.1 hypothetical protein GFH48_28065 [Streptomyces fagopyri]
MSDHQHQERQQQPGWGGPPQAPGHGASAPRPPRKRGVGRVVGLGLLGVLGLIVVIGIAGAAGRGGGADEDSGASNSSVHNEARSEARSDSRDGSGDGAGDTGAGSQAADFRSCVDKNGTATEKAAVRHITKVTGADKRNNILDAPEVFTDFSGGLTGPHQGEGKLIASAFSSCYESDNGLVTVYDKAGQILANGTF